VSLSSITVYVSGNGTSSTYAVDVYNDGIGVPGSSIWTSGNQTATANAVTQPVTFNPGISTIQGQRYWIVITGVSGAETLVGTNPTISYSGLGSVGTYANSFGSPFNWIHQNNFIAVSYTVSNVPNSGQWTSPIYDSLSDSVSTGMSLNMTASY